MRNLTKLALVSVVAGVVGFALALGKGLALPHAGLVGLASGATVMTLFVILRERHE